MTIGIYPIARPCHLFLGFDNAHCTKVQWPNHPLNDSNRTEKYQLIRGKNFGCKRYLAANVICLSWGGCDSHSFFKNTKRIEVKEKKTMKKIKARRNVLTSQWVSPGWPHCSGEGEPRNSSGNWWLIRVCWQDRLVIPQGTYLDWNSVPWNLLA